MVTLSGYKGHQDSCEFRLVRCPGRGSACKDKLVAFSDVENHTSNCLGMMRGFSTVSEKGGVYSQLLEDRFVGTAIISWPTRTIKHNNATFFFKMRKVSDNYQLEVVMKGSLTDCRLFTTEISILDYDSEEAVFKTSFQPRPIDTEQWGDSPQICTKGH